VVAPLIAIVDDEVSVQRAIGRLVRAAGLDAEFFSSAEEFLEAHSVRTHHCLILDLGLPGINGRELQSRLLDSGTSAKPPIIFVSAHDDPESRDCALSAGAAAFFGKPFDQDALLEAIHAVLNGDQQ
jgi:FixJ family two-component response regulator